MPLGKLVGARILRREDPRLLRGLARYVDDIRLSDTLHAAFVRSPHAHARILSIRTERALRAPGVVAVLTGADIRGVIGDVPVDSQEPSLRIPRHPVLATDKACFAGEGVVVVVAENRYLAEDALDLIEVGYEALPAVSDPELALTQASPVVHAEWPDNAAFRSARSQGDLDAAFRQADKVVKQRFVHQRLAPLALETRAVMARFQPEENQLTVWSSTQIPHLLKSHLAKMLKLAEAQVRVVAPDVGGAFGSKLNIYAEEALVAHLAMRLGRPVKWIEGRRENMHSTIHGRGQVGEIEAAVKNDGRILALRSKVVADLGAYHQLYTPGIPRFTGLMLSGCYKIPAIGIELTGVFTNKMSTDAYRGAGRPEAIYVIERMMDRIAGELGMDPAALRRRNFPQPDEFPLATATGLSYDSGNYQAALDKALRQADYPKLRREQKRLRKQGRYLGIGLSTYVEICAMGPGLAEYATVRVEPTGKTIVLTGASPHGQGQETSFAQIVGDELGVELDDITVMHGDTAEVPKGVGTFGSRATAVGGVAVLQAAEKVKQQAREIAAHLLEADPEDIVFADGKFGVQGAPKKALTLRQIAAAAHQAGKLPKQMPSALSAGAEFEPANFTFPFGAHLCVVEVDPESGAVKIKKYIAVDDCGKVINPLLVEGQIHGGIAQGLGQALYEEVIYDEDGRLATASLMDYALPRAENFPRFDLAPTETPTPVNPLGAKGIGEAGTIGSTPAVVNAVVDALAPFGVVHIDMPLKPEKIWRLCRGAKA